VNDGVARVDSDDSMQTKYLSSGGTTLVNSESDRSSEEERDMIVNGNL
jgi:hypothetical protein